MRALCVGDLHIEQGANLGAPGERVAEQERAWARALHMSRETGCDVVLFAGDAWERRAPSPDGYLAFIRPLVRHYDVGGPRVIAIPGNHDLQSLEAGAALDVAAAAGLIELYREPASIEAGDVIISCLPWAPVHGIVAKAERGTSRDSVNEHAARALEDIAAKLGAHAHALGVPSVLLTHFSITGATTATGADVGVFREPVLDRNVIGGGHAIVVAGHIHKRQAWDNGFYVGSLTPLNFGETGEHGVTFLHIDADGVRTDFVEVESREFVTWDYTPDEVEDMATAQYEMGHTMVPLDGAYLRIRYDATPEQSAAIDKPTLRAAAIARGAHRVWIHEHVERARRERGTALPDDLTATESLALYLTTVHDLPPDELEHLLRRATPYLQAAR